MFLSITHKNINIIKHSDFAQKKYTHINKRVTFMVAQSYYDVKLEQPDHFFDAVNILLINILSPLTFYAMYIAYNDQIGKQLKRIIDAMC